MKTATGKTHQDCYARQNGESVSAQQIGEEAAREVVKVVVVGVTRY